MFDSLSRNLSKGYTKVAHVDLKVALILPPERHNSPLGAGILYFARLFGLKADLVASSSEWKRESGRELVICESPLICRAVSARLDSSAEDSKFEEFFQLARQDARGYSHILLPRTSESGESGEGGDWHRRALDVLDRLGVNYTVVNRRDESAPLDILRIIGAIAKSEEAKELSEIPESPKVAPAALQVPLPPSRPAPPTPPSPLEDRQKAPEEMVQKFAESPSEEGGERPWPFNFLH